MSTKHEGDVSARKFFERMFGHSLDLAETLRSIRLCDELSLSEFAAKLGISRSHLCDIEKRRKAVSLTRAIEWAEVLGYSKDQFARLALQTLVNAEGLPYRVVLEAESR